MSKSYDQYCPIAHALDLVGERWSLLVVRELLHEGPLRYSDLHGRLDGCGTNILAARLKALEQGGVVRRRRLDPPAASWVYELTEYGEGLREVLHVLAHWGARSLRPACCVAAISSRAGSPARCASRSRATRSGASSSGSATRSPRSQTARSSKARSKSPTRSIVGDPPAFYCLMVDRDIDAVSIEGDASVVRSTIASLPPAATAEVPA